MSSEWKSVQGKDIGLLNKDKDKDKDIGLLNKDKDKDIGLLNKDKDIGLLNKDKDIGLLNKDKDIGLLNKLHVHTSRVKSYLIYGNETWPIKLEHETQSHRNEMGEFRWFTLKDRKADQTGT